MITDLWIENFKGIGKRQHIPLRPITLLFGANSAGKSTVLHALLYLREVLRSGTIDLSKALAGAQTVNLGGIENLLNSRDGITSTTLKIGVSVSLHNLSEKRPHDLSEVQNAAFQQAGSLFPLQIDSYDLHLTVGRVRTNSLWRVTQAELFINSESFMRFFVADDELAVGTVNLLHPGLSINLDRVLNPIFDYRTEFECPTELTIQIAEQDLERYRQACNALNVLTQTVAILPRNPRGTLDSFMQLGVLEYPREICVADFEQQTIESLLTNQDAIVTKSFREYMKTKGAAKEWIDTIDHSVLVILDESEESRPLPIAILFGQCVNAHGKQISELPAKDFRDECVKRLRRAWVKSGPDGVFDAGEQFEVEILDFGGHAFPVGGRQVPLPPKPVNSLSINPSIREAKTRLLQFVGACTLGLLEKLTYLGPKRATVPRNLNSDVMDEFSNWGDGLGAWRWMLQCDDDDLTLCSIFLSEQATGLGTGFTLEREEVYEIPSAIIHHYRDGQALEAILEHFGESDEGHVFNDWESAKSFKKIILREQRTGKRRHPQDVGEGITQVIPVIAAFVRVNGEGGLIAIEQPELHLHPALAAKLGDLAISATLSNFSTFSSSTLIETHSEHLILRILRRIRQTTDGELPEHIPPVKPDDVCVLWVDNLGDGTTIKRLRIDGNGEFIDRWPKGFFSERAEELY